VKKSKAQDTEYIRKMAISLPLAPFTGRDCLLSCLNDPPFSPFTCENAPNSPPSALQLVTPLCFPRSAPPLRPVAKPAGGEAAAKQVVIIAPPPFGTPAGFITVQDRSRKPEPPQHSSSECCFRRKTEAR
jgi:hypothetical protein